MKLQIELKPELVEALLEAEIAGLPESEKDRIRGHGTRSRETVRRSIARKLEEVL